VKREANLVLEAHMQELGLNWKPEYQFYSPRKWRADYLITYSHPIKKCVLIEIEGGVYAHGRHTLGKGYEADCIKYSTASAMGFLVFRFSTGQVLDGTAKNFLKEWLK
jgi:hypothetical protein